jgi:molybdopterin-containing oxidoreductase family iron-sulfur binding subunit
MDSKITGRVGRREFLKAGVAGISLGVLGGCVEKEKAFEIAKKPVEGVPKTEPELFIPENVPPGQGALTRMHVELARAIKKPAEELRWKMVININRCIGCYACEVACISENVSPPGVTLRKVFVTEYGTFPNVKRTFMPSNCMQCNNPPCVEAAPMGGMRRRPDGIVMIYPKKFKNKEEVDAVIKACPYKNAIFYDDGSYFTSGLGKEEGAVSPPQPYEAADNYQYVSVNGRKELVGRPRKCDFCYHRLRNGMLPACVSTCIGGAMYFGDGNDPDSLVSELMRTNQVAGMNGPPGAEPPLNTEPNVVYIASEVPDVMAGLKSCMSCHKISLK